MKTQTNARFRSTSIRAETVDRAVRSAAGACSAVVVDYVATPREGRSVEVAIEFFVPPASKAGFAESLKYALNLGLATPNDLNSPVVHSLPPGTLHQWRIVWRQTEAYQRTHRWTTDRVILDSVLHQADHGFREIHNV